MNMTEKNGQPSMEEILASIRRIIAEEPGSQQNGELRGQPIILKGDGVLEDAGDFDLPAIFRSSPPATNDRQTPLLGRLTDAIRSATTAPPETRGASANEDHARAEELVGAAASAGGFPGLSSLRSVRPVEPGPSEPLRPVNQPAPVDAPSAASSGTQATASSEGSGDAPKRVMAPFKDTHFLRMSGPMGAASSPPATAAAPPVELPAALPPEPAPHAVDFSAIVPGQIDRTGLMNGVSVAPPPLAAEVPAAVATSLAVLPPLVPGSDVSGQSAAVSNDGEQTGSIEDTTADLLRPMLRAWLADNMPRMVEKALHIEIAESVKTPKKP